MQGAPRNGKSTLGIKISIVTFMNNQYAVERSYLVVNGCKCILLLFTIETHVIETHDVNFVTFTFERIYLVDNGCNWLHKLYFYVVGCMVSLLSPICCIKLSVC